MKITFLGASGNVTGSRFLLETQRQHILIDCGLFQERNLLERNWAKFPFNPAKIKCVLLTHAHIDHCGYLPKLIKDGFRGKIYCTGPTAEITKINLLDAAKLQEYDVQLKKMRHQEERRQSAYPEVPLYTTNDAQRVFPFLRKISYKKEISLSPVISAVFYDAGHILGAAMIELRVTEGSKTKTVVFSGDIGRWDRPLLNDPTTFKKADCVIMEATYGNRVHESDDLSLEKLESIINETYKRGGNIIIPSFAIGRTQEILYDLNQLLRENRIPNILTFVDSPMAIEITKIFEQFPLYLDKEAQIKGRLFKSLFQFPLLKTSETTGESKAINKIKGTTIVLAGAGMCTGGRIKHHLVQNISRPESTILFVGYQAQGTLGRVILEKPSQVRILGRMFPVRAHIEKINGFSAHADQNELLKWTAAFKKKPAKIFIVHAEEAPAAHFAQELRKKGFPEVIIPSYLQEHVI